MIKQISHIGIAVRDLEKAREFYRSVFRLQPSEPIIGGGGEVKVSLVELGNTTIELLQPVGDKGAVAKFLERRGEGIHHLCLEVDDINSEVEFLRASGVEVIGSPGPGAEGISVFLHPKTTQGVLIELVQKEEAKPT